MTTDVTADGGALFDSTVAGLGLLGCLLAALPLLLAACGSSNEETATAGPDGSAWGSETNSSALDSNGPLAAASFSYEVAYGELSISGEAEVTYTNAVGEDLTESVTMPWESERSRWSKDRDTGSRPQLRLVTTPPSRAASPPTTDGTSASPT